MPRVTQAEYEILAGFRYSLRKFLRFSEETARSAGLTPRQHQVLLSIKGSGDAHGRVTISQLAELMQLRHNSTVGLVDRLEGQGFLQRERSRADRREVFAKLSPKGEVVLERLSSLHKEELRRMLPELGQLMEILSGELVDSRPSQTR